MEFKDVSQLMFVWRAHVFDAILDRKSPLLWKDIKACGHAHKHREREREREREKERERETHTHRHAHTYAYT